MATLNTFNPVQDFQSARQNALDIEQRQQNLGQTKTVFDQKQARGQTKFDQGQALKRAKILGQSAQALLGISEGPQRDQALLAITPQMKQFDIDGAQFTGKLTDENLKNLIAQSRAFIGSNGDPESIGSGGFILSKDQTKFDDQGKVIARGVTSSGGNLKGTSQTEFENLTKGLSEDEKRDAILIKLGINPRAVSSADITIAESDVLTEQVANSKAIIGQRKKFGELSGASRAKAIDKGFEKIVKIDAGLRNIDRAIAVLGEGAGVGAIERFLPSFKAASIELSNIQKSMALDVIGAVTFGALSKGELDLAKEVALPTGLDTPELIEHLQKRKAAQEKLRAYFNEQIQFLDQGGTIAGFLRKKEAEASANSTGQPDQQPAATPEAAPITATGPNGERIQFINGQWVPLQ